MIRRLAAVVAAGCLLAPAAPAAAAPDPALPRGAAPEVTWQSGATVHLRRGGSVDLPGRAAAGQVLGRRDGAWLVWVDGGEPEVLAVRGDRVRTVWHHTYDESATSYTLVDGADRVVEWNYTRGGSSYASVFDLRGREVASRSWPGFADLLSADADGLLVSGRRQTVRWVPGRTPVAVGPAADLADPRQDLLVVAAGGDAVGPTPLSAPGTPPWSAVLDPEAVSPDGTWLAGATYTRRPRLVVRRVADGVPAPVPALRLDRDPVVVGPSHVQVAWEPDGDLLLVVRGERGRAVVRCTVAGACERATAWLSGSLALLP